MRERGKNIKDSGLWESNSGPLDKYIIVNIYRYINIYIYKPLLSSKLAITVKCSTNWAKSGEEIFFINKTTGVWFEHTRPKAVGF